MLAPSAFEYDSVRRRPVAARMPDDQALRPVHLSRQDSFELDPEPVGGKPDFGRPPLRRFLAGRGGALAQPFDAMRAHETRVLLQPACEEVHLPERAAAIAAFEVKIDRASEQ